MRTAPTAKKPAAKPFDLALASPEQAAIFDWFRTGTGNLLVRARAGTGKTTTILAGAAMAPGAILLAAFNRDIALELQARISDSRIEAKTLHSLGFRFVAYNWKGIKVEEGGNRRKMALAIAAAEAIKPSLSMRAARNNPVPEEAVKIIAELHTKAREIQPFARTGGDLLDLVVAFNLVPTEGLAASGWTELALCHAAHRAMMLAKVRPTSNEIDYSDMIYLPLANNWARAWYDLVVIDEAQDMNRGQLELALRACRRTGRICVVGDDRQAIYAFRGADSGSLDRLKLALNAPELGLTITRRCPKAVVQLAQALVPDFRAAPDAPAGVVRRCEADAMVDEAAVGDFVLSRTNAPLIRICLAILKRGVRACVRGRDIGKGIQALLRKLAVRKLGELRDALTTWVQHETDRATEHLAEGAREQRIDFVNDQAALILALAEDVDSLDALDRRIVTLFSDDDGAAKVTCSSVHRAKGLEADRVYLLEGTFRDGSVEEDNLQYVAMTRTKHTLVWVQGFER